MHNDVQHFEWIQQSQDAMIRKLTASNISNENSSWDTDSLTSNLILIVTGTIMNNSNI